MLRASTERHVSHEPSPRAPESLPAHLRGRTDRAQQRTVDLGWRLAREIVRRVDENPERLAQARLRFAEQVAARPGPTPVPWRAWTELLERPWEEVRAELLAPTDAGDLWRSTCPLVGVVPLRDRERLREPR